MYTRHRIFFFLGLLFVFVLFFLYLVYYQKHDLFFPKPPVISSVIPASDSTTFPGAYQYDFENITDKNIVTNECAFSGKNALKVSGKRSYSPAIQVLFDDYLQGISEALFGAWIYVVDTAKDLEGKLMFQIVDKSNKLKYSTASDIKEQKNKKKNWFYVCGKADWKEQKVQPDDLVKIYFWNNCNNTVYIDNIQVVFGKQLIKGEKALTDKSSQKNRFIPSVNQPPYPPVFFEKDLANNLKNTAVYPPDGKDSLLITAEDVFCPGRFFRSDNNCEQILVLRKNKPFSLLWYEQQKSLFLFIKLPPEVIAYFPEMDIFSIVDFNNDGTDELITCSGDKVQSIYVYKILAFKPYLKMIHSGQTEQFDISGNIVQIEPIMTSKGKYKAVLLDEMGHVFMLRSGGNKFISSAFGVIPEAAREKYDCKIVCGNFIHPAENVVLLFFTEKKSEKCSYGIYAVDDTEQNLEMLVQGTFDNKCDTLFAGNDYFKCDINNDKMEELLSFSKGWRYDGKVISFNKGGYVIDANIDFAGYPKDHNPKYFEKLSVVAGNFMEKNTTSVFTFCGSLKNENSPSTDMPPYVGIFSYKNKK